MPPASTALTLDQICDGKTILADRAHAGDRHLALGSSHGLLRLWLRSYQAGSGLTCTIPTDDLFTIRIEALRWFHDCVNGTPPKTPPSCLFPTPFQRHRLTLMLQILDALDVGYGQPPTVRELARTIVYPHTHFANAAEWKASSERRRTQRLIEEAQFLTNGGYHALLKGQMR